MCVCVRGRACTHVCVHACGGGGGGDDDDDELKIIGYKINVYNSNQLKV